MAKLDRAIKRLRRVRWRKLHPKQWAAEKRRRYERQQEAKGKKPKPWKFRYSLTQEAQRRLEREYGITHREFEGLLELQKGRCAICEVPLKPRGSPGYTSRPCVDHDHRTNIVRGILCGPCNRGLGLFRDDLWLVSRAAKYLLVHLQRMKNQ